MDVEILASEFDGEIIQVIEKAQQAACAGNWVISGTAAIDCNLEKRSDRFQHRS